MVEQTATSLGLRLPICAMGLINCLLERRLREDMMGARHLAPRRFPHLQTLQQLRLPPRALEASALAAPLALTPGASWGRLLTGVEQGSAFHHHHHH